MSRDDQAEQAVIESTGDEPAGTNSDLFINLSNSL